MGYDIAVNKAWDDLLALSPPKNTSLKFLADEYSVDLDSRRVVSLSCNVPAKDFVVILVLHYLAKELQGLAGLTGEWLGFKELSAIEGYQAAFKKRVNDRIANKYGANPEALFSVLERFPGKRVKQGDIGVVLEVFSGVPVLIELWKADEEFGPEANILFDKSISRIFCIEDIVVLAEFVAGSI